MDASTSSELSLDHASIGLKQMILRKIAGFGNRRVQNDQVQQPGELVQPKVAYRLLSAADTAPKSM